MDTTVIIKEARKRFTEKVFGFLTVRSAVMFVSGLIIAWGLLNAFGSLNPASFYSFSHIASTIKALGAPRGDETLAIAPSSSRLDSGDLFTLSFRHANGKGDAGEYALSYPCAPDFKLERLYDNTIKELTCGKKTFLGGNGLGAVTLKATLEKGETLDVPLTAFYTVTGAEENTKALYAQTLVTVESADGAHLIVVTTSAESVKTGSGSAKGGTSPSAGSGTRKATPPKSTPPPKPTGSGGSSGTASVVNYSTPTPGTKTEKTYVYYSTGPTPSNPNGTIDLEGRILEIGFVDKNTNVFTASSSPSANLRIAVRFEVINLGTKVSGSWSFNAVLPTMPFHIYSGDSQLPLMPGEKIEFIIGFDSIERKKDAEFILNVDPTSRVVESNEGNNIVKVMIHPAF